MGKYTKKDINYIENQLEIIQEKTTIKEINKYMSSLHYANSVKKIVKDTLFKACDVRISEIDRSEAFCVETDFSDMGGQFNE